MGDLAVQFEESRTLVSKHRDAASGILSTSRTMPTSLDGGIGGPTVMAWVSQLAKDAAALGSVIDVMGAYVSVAVDRFDGTDQDAAERFWSVSEALPDESGER